MKNLILAVLTLAGFASAQISALSLPHTLDSATIPKVSYVDDNDVALKNKLNVVVDSVNADSVRTLLQSFASLRLTIDADANATGTCIAFTHNGAADTIAKFCDDLSGKAYGRFSVVDSIIGASMRLTGNQAAANGTYSGTLEVTGTFTNTALAGTSTRLTTSTSTGVQGNATTIAGANTWSDVQTFTSAPVFSSATASLPLFTNGSKAATSNAMTGTGSVVMSASPTLTGTAAFANTTNSGTSAISGIQTNNEAITFGANGTSADYTLYRSAGSGLTFRGGAGSTNDFAILSQAGNVVFRIPTGTSTPTLIAPALGAATATSLVASGNVTADSLISSKFYEEGSFTGTLSGCASGGTGTIRYTRVGKQVTLLIPTITCTSNSAVGRISGIPASLNAARNVALYADGSVVDNSTGYPLYSTQGMIFVAATAGYIQLYFAGSTTFTASGNKGFNTTASVSAATYTLQ